MKGTGTFKRGQAHGQAYKAKKAKPVKAKMSTPAGSKVSKRGKY